MRRIILSGMMVFFLFGLWSETSAASFGVKGGLNLANFKVSPTTPDLPEFRDLKGLTGGVFLTFNLGLLTIQPEFLYARRGTHYEVTENFITFTAQYRLDYLEGLLLLKFSPILIGPVKPFLLSGPSLGYLTRARAVALDEDGNEIISLDVKERFNNTELAAVLGAGVEIKVPVVKISLETRYHLGLSNIARSQMEVDYIKNKGLAVLLGLAF